MIFVTVGTDLPFDRLVREVDAWAASRGRLDVFAQIGNSQVTPTHVAYSAFLPPDEFNRRFADAKVVVAHAGMGSILSALRWRKPILVMPRRAALGETRNDHQVATARHLAVLEKVSVATDEHDLRAKLDRLDELRAGPAISSFATQELLDALHEFISETGTRR